MVRLSCSPHHGLAVSSFMPLASAQVISTQWPITFGVLANHDTCMKRSAMAAPSTSSQVSLPQHRHCSLFLRHRQPTSMTATGISWTGAPIPEISQSITRNGRELQMHLSMFRQFVISFHLKQQVLNKMPFQRNRLLYALAGVAVIGLGLVWRSRWLSLPSFVAKYGGDALWAMLVFLGVGFLWSRASTLRVTLISLGFAWAVEFSQLYHAPWIDSIRATRIGSLILGSTFNAPDLLAYGVGIALCAFAECICSKRHKTASRAVH